MARLTLEQHLTADGPKRLLALDGGGVRGILALSYLKRIETLLRERYGDPSFVLSDYFDLIGGTSTGAIIAAGLAKGYDVETLQGLYRTMAADIFRRSWWRGGLVFPRYHHGRLREILDQHFGDYTLGDARLRTGIMIMTKRWDTGSPWVLHNHPRGVYYGSGQSCDESPVPNRCYNLAQVVRASTAAPTYFRPESIEIGKGVVGRFVDGGVTPHNNPALQVLLVATLHGYGFRWQTGQDNLLLVSVGTGKKNRRIMTTPRERVARRLAVYDGITSLAGLMSDCDALNQMVLQSLSEAPNPWEIDSEVGNLSGDLLAGRPLFAYRRYNVKLESEWLRAHLEISVSEKEAARLFEMDRPENIATLEQIGERAALHQVAPEHFPAVFDVVVDASSSPRGGAP